jgi:hypothetical protein
MEATTLPTSMVSQFIVDPLLIHLTDRKSDPAASFPAPTNGSAMIPA